MLLLVVVERLTVLMCLWMVGTHGKTLNVDKARFQSLAYRVLVVELFLGKSRFSTHSRQMVKLHRSQIRSS